jgi:hypothetical protein
MIMCKLVSQYGLIGMKGWMGGIAMDALRGRMGMDGSVDKCNMVFGDWQGFWSSKWVILKKTNRSYSESFLDLETWIR